MKSTEEVENEYKKAYALFESEKFTESKEVIDQTIQKFPKDALVPKLYLLNAFNAGKSSGKEVMILQLEQIALNYSKTPEGVRAKEMLNYLKSDLSFQATDNKGNTIPQQPSGAPVQPNAQNTGISQMNNGKIQKLDSAQNPNMNNTAPQQNPGQQNPGQQNPKKTNETKSGSKIPPRPQ
ncbi:hypothetical protein OWR28_23450 [Chryseobacterium sp. 1B4]